MPKGRKNKKSRKGNHRGARRITMGSSGPPSGATAYSGPVIPRMSTRTDIMTTARIVSRQIISTTAVGTISAQYNNQATSAYTDIANFQGLYSEVRVLAQRVRWEPFNLNFANSGFAQGSAPAVFSVNRVAGASPPATTALAFGSGEVRVFNTSQRAYIDVRAGVLSEMDFQQSAAHAATWVVSLNSDTLTASTVYGVLWSELLVQFRNRV